MCGTNAEVERTLSLLTRTNVTRNNAFAFAPQASTWHIHFKSVADS